MIILIETKNGALSKTITATGITVPRAGEEIDLGQDGGYLQGSTRLMVHDVIYQLENDHLTPVVRCRPSRSTPDKVNSARRELLEELGWHPRRQGSD
jgi:hypothetical protein